VEHGCHGSGPHRRLMPCQTAIGDKVVSSAAAWPHGRTRYDQPMTGGPCSDQGHRGTGPGIVGSHAAVARGHRRRGGREGGVGKWLWW
jgi:hypothetical protein